MSRDPLNSLYILVGDGESQVADSVLDWGVWFESSWPARQLAETTLGAVRVSTVFLCIDHTFGRHGIDAPILWETMIFGGEHDSYQDRYSSKADALQGHARAVALVRSTAPNEPT